MVDKDPVVAAQNLIDRHIVKMPSESCIMMANAYDNLNDAPKTKSGGLRNKSYSHHGCTKWAIKTLQNFKWLTEHSIALCEEYTYRYNKIHFCETFIRWCQLNPPELNNGGFTNPFLAMPEIYKNNDWDIAYRLYYTSQKKFDKSGKYMYNWTIREKPLWA